MNSEELYTEVGALVAYHRRRSRLSQKQLAELINLSRPTVANIERGKQSILLHQLFAIAAALAVPIEELLPKSHDVVPALATPTGDYLERLRRIAVPVLAGPVEQQLNVEN